MNQCWNINQYVIVHFPIDHSDMITIVMTDTTCLSPHSDIIKDEEARIGEDQESSIPSESNCFFTELKTMQLETFSLHLKSPQILKCPRSI